MSCPAGTRIVASIVLTRGQGEAWPYQRYRRPIFGSFYFGGSRPVTLGAVTVGLQSSGGNLLSGKAQQVLFHGKPEVIIPVGEELYSDEVALDIDPADPLVEGHNLAVSLFVKGASGPLTWHCDAFYTSYLSAPGRIADTPKTVISTAGRVVSS